MGELIDEEVAAWQGKASWGWAQRLRHSRGMSKRLAIWPFEP